MTETVAELFSTTFSEYGGTLRPDRFDGTTRRVWEAVTPKLHERLLDSTARLADIPDGTSRRERTYLAYVDNRSPNATVIHTNGVYLIGINGGLSVYILRIVLALFSQNGVFNELGAASPTLDTQRQDFQPVLDLDPSQFDLQSDSSFQRAFENSARAELAVTVCSLVVQFFAVHEAAHVERGHLDYLMDHSQGRYYREFPAKDDIYLASELIQSFEMDADNYATTHLVSEVVRQETYLASEFPSICANTSEGLSRILVFATGIALFVFSRCQRSVEPTAADSHPTPSMRFVVALTWVRDSFLKRSAVDQHGLNSGMAKAVRDLETASRELGFPMSDILADKEVAYREYAHLQRLADVFDSVKEDLQVELQVF